MNAAEETTAMDVSVVIPVGGVDDLVRAQLDALAKQTFDGSWEIVLALNASGPAARRDLETLAARYSNARVVDASQQRGASYARNTGAAAARGAFLAFCDGDDLVDPDWLNALTAARARGSVVGGHLEEELLSVPGQENWRPPATPGGLPSFLDHPYPVSANMGVDRLVFEKLGGFVENLTRGEDMAFGFSVSNAGETLVYAPEAIVHYRHRAGFRSMLEQHYLYGIGMSEIISRGLLPTTGGRDASGMRSLRPNGQRVERPSVAQFARRGSIAVGRVVGLIKERRRNNTTA